MRMILKILRATITVSVMIALAWGGYQGFLFYQKTIQEKETLKKIIARLEADSRIAEVLVTRVVVDPLTQKDMTTIKFLEYDSKGRALTPKYFTFSGDIIQFQSLVVRFDDELIRGQDALRGKSAYLFWKVFLLDGARTQEYAITRLHEVPAGYRLDEAPHEVEKGIWQKFWVYALDGQKALSRGIKNAQIEAPGTKFIPGILYTLRIEHDGGIRIDTQKIPEILRGETIY